MPYPKPSTDYPIVTREKVWKDEPYEIISQKERGDKPCYIYTPNELLFSRRVLINRGEIESSLVSRENTVMLTEAYLNTVSIAKYSDGGVFEKLYTSTKELTNDGYLLAKVKKALKDPNLKYAKKYFRIVEKDEEPEDSLNVPLIGIIDGIPFGSFVDAAHYLCVTRQAVHQQWKSKKPMVAGKEAIWFDTNEKI